MKVTVLAENQSSHPSIGAEHGLSLYIEAKDKHILFDMGQSDLFYRNALALGVDISRVDFAILSHGHYDHGGGIQTFLSVNHEAPIYLTDAAFGRYYNGKTKYIGLDQSLQSEERLMRAADPMTLGEGIRLLTCNAYAEQGENDPYGLTEHLFDGSFVPDRFLHEQYLLIEENGKRILFTGCAHKGILRLMEWLKPDVVIGGFHFKSIVMDKAGCSKLDIAASKLQKYDAVYYTCHCTGIEQYNYLRRKSERINALTAGDMLVL